MAKEIVDTDVLPCGCVITRAIIDGKKVLEYSRCKRDCINFLNAMGLASDANLPVEYKRS